MTSSTGAYPALADLLREYGNAWRGDWSDCDGRAIKSEMGYVAGLIVQVSEGGGLDVAEARRELGLCAGGRGHWMDHCDSGCLPTSEKSEDSPS